MNPDAPVLAVDVGGTKLAAALVDTDGAVVRRVQVPTEPNGSGESEALWAALRGLVDRVIDGVAVRGVGVGCGGPMRWPAGEVSPLNIAAWRDFPLRARLAEHLPGVPVRLVNDAIAMTIGEHWRGAGSGADTLLGMVVSTGVGGGLILGGRVDFGATGNAGHLGHVVVDPAGPPCACGGVGCLEAIARGPAVVRAAVDRGWRPAEGAPADGRSLVAAADSGDAVALEAITRAGTAIGVALTSAVHLLDLDGVVVGGGFAAAGDLLLAPARAAFARHARLPFAARCTIRSAALAGDAGLVGAAALVLHGERYWTAGAD